MGGQGSTPRWLELFLLQESVLIPMAPMWQKFRNTRSLSKHDPKFKGQFMARFELHWFACVFGGNSQTHHE